MASALHSAPQSRRNSRPRYDRAQPSDVDGWPVYHWTRSQRDHGMPAELDSRECPVVVRGSPKAAKRSRLLRLRQQYVAKNYGFTGKALHQARADLRRIEPGTLVVPYLINRPKTKAAWRALEQLGIRPTSRHAVGRLLEWSDSIAESAWLTRWVIFDPGDAALRRIRRERTMRVGTYSTKYGPGILVVPTRSLSRYPKTWLRFETQYDGDYGMSWPTELGAPKAIAKVVSEFTAPERQDAALVVGADGSSEDMTSEEFNHRLALGSLVAATFVRAEFPDGAVTWAAAGHGSEYGKQAHKMTMAVEGFDSDALHRILQGTLYHGSDKFVDDAISEAQYYLGSAGTRD